jgi:hypothetical protein
MNTPPNITSLRETLIDTVDGLRRGEVQPATAEAITNASGKIVSTIRVQLEYARATSTVPRIPFMEGDGK